MVSRHGATAAAEFGAASGGPISDQAYAQLRRSARRYERHADFRPDGWPAGGLAALAHVGQLAGAGELPQELAKDPPRTVGYAIGLLEQVASRMRALDRAAGPDARRAVQTRRAERRVEARPRKNWPPQSQLEFRVARGALAPVWPAWLLVPGFSEPVFDSLGRLVLNSDAIAAGVPQARDDHYRVWVLTAFLLAGRRPPYLVVGGSSQPLEAGAEVMAERCPNALPTGAAPARVDDVERDLIELAGRTGQPLETVRHWQPAYRTDLLASLRRQDRPGRPGWRERQRPHRAEGDDS